MKTWISLNFSKFATELRPLIDVRIEFLFNILKTNRRIKTKFCKHIIIDKIYFGIVICCFSQIGNRVTALDRQIKIWFLAHLSRRLIGELIVYQWSGVRRRRPSASVHIFKHLLLQNRSADQSQILC